MSKKNLYLEIQVNNTTALEDAILNEYGKITATGDIAKSIISKINSLDSSGGVNVKKKNKILSVVNGITFATAFFTPVGLIAFGIGSLLNNSNAMRDYVADIKDSSTVVFTHKKY